MNIKFDETVTSRIIALTAEKPADFVFDYDDSMNDAISADACAIVTRLKLIAVDKGQVPDLFDGIIESPLGDLHVKEWGKRFLDENMNMRMTESGNGLIEIMGDGGILSSNAEIADYRTK